MLCLHHRPNRRRLVPTLSQRRHQDESPAVSRGVDGDVAGKERVECGARCDDGSFGAAWTPHRPSTAARNINWFTDSDHTDTRMLIFIEWTAWLAAIYDQILRCSGSQLHILEFLTDFFSLRDSGNCKNFARSADWWSFAVFFMIGLLHISSNSLHHFVRTWL